MPGGGHRGVPDVTAQNGTGMEPSADIYARLLKNRIVFLGSEVNDQVANFLVSGYWGGQTQHFNVTQGGSITVNVTALTSAGCMRAASAATTAAPSIFHQYTVPSAWRCACDTASQTARPCMMNT